MWPTGLTGVLSKYFYLLYNTNRIFCIVFYKMSLTNYCITKKEQKILP